MPLELLLSKIYVEDAGFIEIYGSESGGIVELTVKLSDDWDPNYNIDLNGLFLDHKEGGNAKTIVDGEKANNLNGLTDDNGNAILWDWSESLGSTVGGSDGNTSNTTGKAYFTGSLADLDGATVGLRATSTGFDSAGSLKLAGEIVVPDEPPVVLNDFPTWAQDISHVVLYFDQAKGDTTGDGYYTVKLDNWPASGDDDLDNSIDDIVDWLIANDPSIDAGSDLLGVVIKGGNEPTQYFAYGAHNANGTDADVVPAGAPQIETPPKQGIVDGSEIDMTYDYGDVLFV